MVSFPLLISSSLFIFFFFSPIISFLWVHILFPFPLLSYWCQRTPSLRFTTAGFLWPPFSPTLYSSVSVYIINKLILTPRDLCLFPYSVFFLPAKVSPPHGNLHSRFLWPRLLRSLCRSRCWRKRRILSLPPCLSSSPWMINGLRNYISAFIQLFLLHLCG